MRDTLYWAKSIARDVGLAVLVLVVYTAGSLMLAMPLAALLGTSLDWPHDPREEIAVLGASLMMVAALLAAPHVHREELPPALPPLAIRQALAQLGGGMLLGIVLVATMVAVFFLAGWYIPPVPHLPPLGASLAVLGPPLFSAFVVAMNEELLDRRLLFPLLERGLGSWLALGLGAAWFGMMHLGNPHAGPAAVVGITLGGGITYTLAFIATRRIWLSVGLHWGWNSALGPLFGLPVSGLDRHVFGQAQMTEGVELWTGGGFGPEAGLVALLVHLPLDLLLIWWILRRRRSVHPVWRRHDLPPNVKIGR